MRIVALGGSGGMGRYAVRTAVDLDAVDEVVVADLDGAAAERFANAAGPKARAATVDVADPDALSRLLAGADAVLNTVGPFYRFGVPVLRAAIEARCHYLDINDDWEPTLDMLGLDAEARAADVCAVVGLGASPGISNLLAVAALRELEHADELVTGWGLGGGGDDGDTDATPGEAPAAPRRPSAAMVHWMHQCSGTIRVYRDGAFTDVAPIEEVEIDYPGIGRAKAWTVGHPEAVTLPAFRPELRRSHNVMVAPRALIDIVRNVAGEIDAGRLDAEGAAALLSQPARTRGERQAERRIEREASPGPQLPPLFAFATGTHAGRPARVGARVLGAPAGGMGGVTGVPLALGLSALAKGQVKGRGVMPPESALDPDAFFDALAPHCNPPFASGADLLMISRSWDT